MTQSYMDPESSDYCSGTGFARWPFPLLPHMVVLAHFVSSGAGQIILNPRCTRVKSCVSIPSGCCFPVPWHHRCILKRETGSASLHDPTKSKSPLLEIVYSISIKYVMTILGVLYMHAYDGDSMYLPNRPANFYFSVYISSQPSSK